MGSLIGHSIPGLFFFFFGLWYTIKFTIRHLRRDKKTGGIFHCSKNIPIPQIVIVGGIKIFLISVGILIEMLVGGPMGRLESPSGSFLQANRWLHTTMYFFFGLSGLCDILSHTAKHIVPAGIDRLGGSLAFFIQGFLFYFHLDGHSFIYTRVHELLILTSWSCAAFLFIQPFLINKEKFLHIAEMLSVVLIIVQGTWFWQTAYVLFPPGGKPSWDPCIRENIPHDGDCHNEEAILNGKFISLFWCWHVAGSVLLVGAVYLLIYLLLKTTRQLGEKASLGYDYSPLDVKYKYAEPLLTEERT